MTDISITSTAVIGDGAAKRSFGTAGEAITAGQAVYLDAAVNKWKLADSDSVVTGANKAGGIALNGAALNQPVAVHVEGDLTVNAVLTKGSAYYLSETPGGIQPVADLIAGENVCQLGIAKSTTVLSVKIVAPGVVV